MYQQLYDHFDSTLSPKQCGFCIGHNGGIALWLKNQWIEGKLYNSFDCIDHNLLIITLSW